VTNNIRFPGQYYDQETGLHYNWNRYYDPGIGRYLSPDPIGFTDSLNLFIYTGNNPVNWIDPWGLEECCPNGGKPYLHTDEYWSCIYQKFAANIEPYAVGIILTGIPSGAGQVVAGVGVISLANLHGYQCRMQATHCDK